MTTIIVIFTALTTIICVVVGVPLFTLYMIRNSIQAAKYRHLVALAKNQVMTGYSIVYKIGRKTETIDVEGNNESEAMKDLIKKGIRYDKIVSLTKK